MSKWKTGLLVLIIVLGCIGCDQGTKQLAKRTLQGTPPRSWLYNTIRLHYTENLGAFLGFGADLSKTSRFWIFLVIPGVVLTGLGLMITLSSALRLQERVLLACLLGGGLSNLLDRAFQDGRVTDFLNVGIGPLRTGVFNVADVLIMGGVIGLAFIYLFPSNKHPFSHTKHQ